LLSLFSRESARIFTKEKIPALISFVGDPND